jgi:hypothetical protein
VGEGGGVLQCDVVASGGDDGAADVAGYLGELSGYLVAEVGLRADGQDRAADREVLARPTPTPDRFATSSTGWPDRACSFRAFWACAYPFLKCPI